MSIDKTTADFLKKMASPDLATRQTAARTARTRGTAAAIPGLADLMASPDKATAKAAAKAIEEITHHAARPGAAAENRAVADALLRVAGETKRPRLVRSHAFFLLGFVGDARVARALQPFLTDQQLGEDARMAQSRISSA